MEVSVAQASETLSSKSDCESELEDGELVDSDDDEPIITKVTKAPSRPLERSDKLVQRAKRFGLLSAARRPPPDSTVRKIQQSMGVTPRTRTETLHLFGTGSMTTPDIFAYFDEYIPASVMWLVDKSCNVLFLDQETCAKALMKHSYKIKGQIDEEMESDEEGSIAVEDLRCALPSGHIWRKGKVTPKVSNLLIRYATPLDKKELKPAPPIELVKKSSLFPDRGDESIKKIIVEDGDSNSNPWSGLAKQWGRFDSSSGRDGKPKDAREVIKQKELRGTLMKRDARNLLSYNKICRLEKELGKDGPHDRIHRRTSLHSDDRRKRGLILKRRHERSSSSDSDRSRDRHRDREKRHKTIPIEENLQIIVANDNYRGSRHRERSRSSSVSSKYSSSSDSSSSDSSSSSDPDEEIMKKTSGDLRFRWKQNSTPFKPSSPLRIEIDNDLYQGKRSKSVSSSSRSSSDSGSDSDSDDNSD